MAGASQQRAQRRHSPPRTHGRSFRARRHARCARTFRVKLQRATRFRARRPMPSLIPEQRYQMLRVLTRELTPASVRVVPMARFRLRLEYVGTRYRGWQVQKNARTVQGELHRAVAAVSGRSDFDSYGSGRTDAGVHALGQVAHLDLETRLAPEPLRRALNDELPADIHVLSVDKTTRQFHARHQATGRSYLYQISRRRTAFGKPFVWWIRDALSVPRMREAAAQFQG